MADSVNQDTKLGEKSREIFDKKTGKPSVQFKPTKSMQREGEGVYNIPLRKAYRKARGKRANYSMKLIQNYLITHTKAEEIKIGSKLNEKIWEKSRQKPPRKVRVKTIMEGTTVKAELMGFEFKDFKALPKAEKKGSKEKLLERLGPKALKKEEEEMKVEGEKKTKKEEAPSREEIKKETKKKEPEEESVKSEQHGK